MAGTNVKDGANRKLETLLKAALRSMVSALEALAGKGLSAEPGKIELTDSASVLDNLELQHAIVVGELARDYAGQTLRFLLPASEAATLAGFMMMTPDEVIAANRKRCRLEGEDLETFGEVANIFCSGIDATLREQLPDEIVLRSKTHGVVESGSDPNGLLGDEELIAFPFSFEVEGFKPSQAMILLEPETAARWNGRELDWGTGSGFGALEGDEPEMPIRGRLAAYLADPESLPEIRTACRRAGLALERHIRTDIPNPAAHVGEIVVLDVPSGDTRRFDWCKRLKAFHSDIRVVLLIHQPSRTRVVQGFLAQADAILGYPVGAEDLAQKLNALFDGAPPESPG